jgi:LAO/AO transport system kinase
VERVVAGIESMLSLAAADGEPPAVVKTVATRDEGIAGLLEAVEAFHRRATDSGALAKKRRAQLRRQLEDAVRQRVMEHVFRRVVAPEELERTLERLAERAVDPFTAADGIVERMGLA